MFSPEDIEQLKDIFKSKDSYGDKLPNVKDVADTTIFYLKSGTTYIEHVMFKNAWHKKVVDGSNHVTLQEV